MSVTRTAQPAQPGQPAPQAAPNGLPAQPNGQPAAPVRRTTGLSVTSRLTAQVRTWLSGTPGRMRQLLIAGAVTAIVFGIAAAQGFAEADGALDRADANTAQLVRIQNIQTNLARADADATTAYLRGGLEPPAQRQDYTTALSTASGLIAEAARSQPADSAALAALNKAVTDYSGLVEQARANNRQGLPIGAQYLKVASNGLRTDAIPVLQNLIKANQERVDLEFGRVTRGFVWLSIAGLLALAVFGLSLMWIARRTHRYVNVPIAIGGGAILLTTVIGAISLSNVGVAVDDVKDGPYSATVALAQARIAAYDAKSNESLTLISRGSGQTYEKAWTASNVQVQSQLIKARTVDSRTIATSNLWDAYVASHVTIRKTDDGGNWEDAVEQAIGTRADNSGNKTFGAFDTEATRVLTTASEQTRAGLGDAGGSLPVARWLSLLIGIVAALCVFWGVSQRLEEYR